MGSFTNWLITRINDKAKRLELIADIVALMSNDEIADVLEDQIDTLNNAGYDWGVFRNEREGED